MYRSFKDAKLAQSFTENGYVVLPLLDHDAVIRLISFYRSLHHTYKTEFGFHVSIDDKNPVFIEKIHDRVMEICLPKLEEHLFDFQAFSGRFLIKEPNRHGIVTPHQDWTFVDEKQSCSAIVWIALVDVDLQNGALGVLKGSHRFDTGYRATPLPLFKMPYDEYANELFPYLELVPMQAGEAMIMDNRLIHGSPPNTTKKDRIVAGFEVARKGAALLHYFLSKKAGQHRVLKYQIDKSFFYHYSNAKLKTLYEAGQEIRNYTVTEILDYCVSPWDKTHFYSSISSLGIPGKNPILKALFDYSFEHIDQVPGLNHEGTVEPRRKSILEIIKSWV